MIKNRESVFIHSHSEYLSDRKVCGLYPLERLINVLAAAGFKKIFISLSEKESSFYHDRIARHLKKITAAEIIEVNKLPTIKDLLRIPSGMFMQPHYFDMQSVYFKKIKNSIVPVERDDQFIIDDKAGLKKAVSLIEKRLIDTTQGYIAKNINKKISVPMSAVISATRIHPNTLTLINFIIGSYGTYLVFLNTHWSMALGGTLFQLASVFDGVDGEVARFTFRSSKLGGWLDTICDHVILLFMLAGVTYLFSLEHGIAAAAICLGFAVLGFLMMVYSNSSYLAMFKTSQSMKAYDTEFILKLPSSDLKVAFILKTRYLAKKEFYSIVFFFAGVSGNIHITLPIFSLVCFVGSIILLRINRQYFPVFKEMIK